MNEDVVGASPACDAPNTSEWSTILLPTKVTFILEVWVYIPFSMDPDNGPAIQKYESWGGAFYMITSFFFFEITKQMSTLKVNKYNLAESHLTWSNIACPQHGVEEMKAWIKFLGIKIQTQYKNLTSYAQRWTIGSCILCILSKTAQLWWNIIT